MSSRFEDAVIRILLIVGIAVTLTAFVALTLNLVGVVHLDSHHSCEVVVVRAPGP